MRRINFLAFNCLIVILSLGLADNVRSQDLQTPAYIVGRGFLCPNGTVTPKLNNTRYKGHRRDHDTKPVTFWSRHYYNDEYFSESQEKNIKQYIKERRLKLYAYLTREYNWNSVYPLKDPYYLKGIAERFFSEDIKTPERYESSKFDYIRQEECGRSSCKWSKKKQLNALLINPQGKKLYFSAFPDYGADNWLSHEGYWSDRGFGYYSARGDYAGSFNLIPDNRWKTGRREARYFCQKDHVLERVVEIRSPNQWGHLDQRGNPVVTPMTIVVKESIINFD